MNGTALVGLDDLIRKIFENIDHVELPETGQKIEAGETLFSLTYGDFSLSIPSPLSGKVRSVNSEHAEHPEWLAIKPFELSWMCGIEPSNLAGELPDLKIGLDSVDWYQKEVDRYGELSGRFLQDGSQTVTTETGKNEQDRNSEYRDLLVEFTQPFLQSREF
jgi:glycine cleavage system H protein